MAETTKTKDYRRILIVFVALAVLTVVEFLVAEYVGSIPLIMILALAKTYLIVNYFMHVYRLWREEAH